MLFLPYPSAIKVLHRLLSFKLFKCVGTPLNVGRVCFRIDFWLKTRKEGFNWLRAGCVFVWRDTLNGKWCYVLKGETADQAPVTALCGKDRTPLQKYRVVIRLQDKACPPQHHWEDCRQISMDQCQLINSSQNITELCSSDNGHQSSSQQTSYFGWCSYKKNRRVIQLTLLHLVSLFLSFTKSGTQVWGVH